MLYVVRFQVVVVLSTEVYKKYRSYARGFSLAIIADPRQGLKYLKLQDGL